MGLYNYYKDSHTHPVNRALHMMAIPLGFSSLYFFAKKKPLAGLAVIPSAFALAWIGHLIEGNKPAFLSNPTHVFVAPVWMAKTILRRDKGQREDARAMETRA
jgi:hypothetical protein